MKKTKLSNLVYKISAIFFLVLGISEVIALTWFIVNPTDYRTITGQDSGAWQFLDMAIVFSASYFLFKRKKIGIILGMLFVVMTIFYYLR